MEDFAAPAASAVVGVPAPRLTAAVMEIDAADASRILNQLEAAGLVVWLDGGWGVDALAGRQTRPHQDLDLVIAREDLAAAQRALAAVGFTHDATAVPGLPARLVLVDAHGRQVDLHPVIFDRHGYGWQDLGATQIGFEPRGVRAGRRQAALVVRLALLEERLVGRALIEVVAAAAISVDLRARGCLEGDERPREGDPVSAGGAADGAGW